MNCDAPCAAAAVPGLARADVLRRVSDAVERERALRQVVVLAVAVRVEPFDRSTPAAATEDEERRHREPLHLPYRRERARVPRVGASTSARTPADRRRAAPPPAGCSSSARQPRCRSCSSRRPACSSPVRSSPFVMRRLKPSDERRVLALPEARRGARAGGVRVAGQEGQAARRTSDSRPAAC